MNKIDIKIDEESFELHRNITGQIFYIVGNRFFPSNYWSDFPIIILTWWIQSLLEITKVDIGSTCEFLFMDGPYLIRAVKIEEESVNMEFIHGIEQGKILFSEVCRIEQFRSILLSTSKRVMSLVEKRGWSTKDTEKLKEAIDLLETHSCSI